MNKIKVIVSALLGSLGLLPALAFAQSNFNLSSGGISGILVQIQDILGMVVPLLIGLAVIVFLWGVLKFLMNANDPDKRGEGRMFMIWGIVGIVIMVSVWGLVGFVQRATGVRGGAAPQAPAIP